MGRLLLCQMVAAAKMRPGCNGSMDLGALLYDVLVVFPIESRMVTLRWVGHGIGTSLCMIDNGLHCLTVYWHMLFHITSYLVGQMKQSFEHSSPVRQPAYHLNFEMQQGDWRDETWSEANAEGGNSRGQRRRRTLLGLLLFLGIAGITVDYFTNRRIEHACLTFIAWVEANPFGGMFAVICVYTLATILFIPGAILTLGCGFAFGRAFDSTAIGVASAAVSVFIGAFIGSLASFLLGRYLFRDCVFRLAANYPILRAVDRALEQNGLKIMLLLRLSPLIPFNALDYISGVTSISFCDYALALFGILPGTIMFCMVGATASSLTDPNSSPQNHLAQQFSLIGGLLFAIVGVAVASYYSKIELDKIVRGAGSPGSTAQYVNVGRVDNHIEPRIPGSPVSRRNSGTVA